MVEEFWPLATTVVQKHRCLNISQEFVLYTNAYVPKLIRKDKYLGIVQPVPPAVTISKARNKAQSQGS